MTRFNDLSHKVALYFGCLRQSGHYLWRDEYTNTTDPPTVPGFPWDTVIDSGLLKNGKHRDVYDGKVFWTCGGKPDLWLAFFWWDNSVDKRGASNSGFYVRGFGPELASVDDAPMREAYILRECNLYAVKKVLQPAFDFACEQWPEVVKRQRSPLVIQVDS